MIALILLPENVGKLTLGVLHLMSLIDHNILPVILVQFESILEDEIVSSDANIPFCSPHDSLSFSSSIWIALVDYLADGRCPFFELSHPVGDRGEWSND